MTLMISEWVRVRDEMQRAYDMERETFGGTHEDALSAATNAVFASLYRDPDSPHFSKDYAGVDE